MNARLALVVMPEHAPKNLGSPLRRRLSAEAVLARFELPDTGFDVCVLNTEHDLAGQVEDALADRVAPDLIVLFCAAKIGIFDGEPYLLLQEGSDEGDSLNDVFGAMFDHAPTTRLVVLLDLEMEGSDVFERAEAAAAVRAVIRTRPGVEALLTIGVDSREGQGANVACSLLAKTLLGCLDGAEEGEAVRVQDVVEPLRLALEMAPHTTLAVVASEGASAVLGPRRAAQKDPPAASAPREQVSRGPVDVAPAVALPTLPLKESSDGPRAPEMGASPADTPRLEPRAIPPSQSSSRPTVIGTPPRQTIAQSLLEGDELAASGQDEEALQRYRKALSLVSLSGLSTEEADRERAVLYARIGEAKLRQDKPREAISSFEKALALDRSMLSRDQVKHCLRTLYLAERDLRAVHRIEEELLEGLSTDAERVAALIVFARSWQTDLSDPLRARERLEHAQALDGGNVEVLRALEALATSDGRKEDAAKLKRRLLELEPGDGARAKGLFSLAKERLTEGREDEALDLLESALDADPASLEPLVFLSRLLGERQEWAELEGTYSRMLGRARTIANATLAEALGAELSKRLAVLRNEHLEDREGALSAILEGLRYAPHDSTLRALACELAPWSSEAVCRRVFQELIIADPTDLDVLRSWFDFLVRVDDVDHAFTAAEALVALGSPRDRERVFVAANRADYVRPCAVVTPEVWAVLRSPPSEVDAATQTINEHLASIFSVLGRVLGAPDQGPDGRSVDPETSTVSAIRTVAWGMKTLGLTDVRVVIAAEFDGGYATDEADPRTVLVGKKTLRGRSLDELAFLVGFTLSGHLPAHRLVCQALSPDELAARFLAVISVVAPESPIPDRLRSAVDLIAKKLQDRLGADDRLAVAEAARELERLAAKVDLVAYRRQVELASIRLAFLFAGDLSTALSLLVDLPSGLAGPDERRAALYRFALSPEALILRKRLGEAG